MKNLQEINELASTLTVEQIEGFSDHEILSMAIQRPGHPGQRGFMLHISYFKSLDHFAKISSALMTRLGNVKIMNEITEDGSKS